MHDSTGRETSLGTNYNGYCRVYTEAYIHQGLYTKTYLFFQQGVMSNYFTTSRKKYEGKYILKKGKKLK